MRLAGAETLRSCQSPADQMCEREACGGMTSSAALAAVAKMVAQGVRRVRLCGVLAGLMWTQGQAIAVFCNDGRVKGGTYANHAAWLEDYRRTDNSTLAAIMRQEGCRLVLASRSLHTDLGSPNTRNRAEKVDQNRPIRLAQRVAEHYKTAHLMANIRAEPAGEGA
ncbi:hypothetical protein ROLI_012010 [Roseobacter fucihabitans]|uniref:Uncharacterized protein n=1 Tax=Roseobacter fucihabitans TaxID=1537242 RepID=A0ABZ2BQB2_9RHOB|nr:hypothetical protein [Roseobacter litoralis]